MWDLTVSSDHDFYINTATADVLVHNNSCPTSGAAAEDTGNAASSFPKLNAQPNFTNPGESPGQGWEWRGKGDPGSPKGSWYNPSTGSGSPRDLWRL